MATSKTAVVLLEMLRKYDVKHVFGLPGETTLPWYNCWHDFPDIKHVLARDERSAAFMADAYARLAFKPGICEGPSVGSTHMIPGVAEAYRASVPMLVFTTDIPLYAEKQNMLTGLDQISLYKSITKETMTITKAFEIPAVVRRAFRLMTSGRPGPVHIRIPMDMFSERIENPDVYSQMDFSRYPGHRPSAEASKIQQAVELLIEKQRPLLICGQGTLFSQAWDEVAELAEFLAIPVATSMTGKGSIGETHPLSIGVIGARGGTSFSNSVVEEADLLFYIGCNTDSATTNQWRLPSPSDGKSIVHLDISEAEVGNTLPTDVNLIGDAKATLLMILKALKERTSRRDFKKIPRIKNIIRQAKAYQEYLNGFMNSGGEFIHPMRFMAEFTGALPKTHVILADPGTSAIYPSAFYKGNGPGRRVIFNYALGALGYAIPAAVGAHFARPNSCIIALTGDGSFGFTSGELETITRIQGDIKVILLNNGSYGWIRAETLFGYGGKCFATDFAEVEYTKIAEGFGLRAYSIKEPEDLRPVLREVFNSDGAAFVDVKIKAEDELVPPVPSWAEKAERWKMEHIY